MMPRVKKWFKMLNSLQHECLAALFSVHTNTSDAAALQTLTRIPDVEHRWLELSARWFQRIRHRDSQHIVTVVRLVSQGHHPWNKSSFAAMDSNEILNTFGLA